MIDVIIAPTLRQAIQTKQLFGLQKENISCLTTASSNIEAHLRGMYGKTILAVEHQDMPDIFELLKPLQGAVYFMREASAWINQEQFTTQE